MTATAIPRRGSTLAELLAALPLLALLGVVAVQLLLAAHRQSVRVDAALAASRELRQSANVLAVELRSTIATDVREVRDTAVEFHAVVGIGVVCAVDAAHRRVSIAHGAPDDAWPVAWSQSPQAGDDVLLWQQSRADTLPSLARTSLDAVRANTGCFGSPIAQAARGAASELELHTVLARSPAVGTPVRITRRTRYALYRASDGDWFLGRRTFGPLGWDVIQPVAGPLLSGAQHGLHFTKYSALGVVIAPADTVTPVARVGVTLRAPKRVGRTAAVVSVDSLEIQVALRGETGAAP